MQNLVFIGLGIGFLFMGVGLYALSLRKPGKSDKAGKPSTAPLNKSQLREQAMLVEETKKMRVGAGCIALLGLGLIAFSFI